MANVLKFSGVSKFDSVSWPGLLTAYKVLKARFGVNTEYPDLVYALAVRALGSSADRDASDFAASMLKRSGIKANEFNQSDLSGFGEEWLGVAYTNWFWEQAMTRSRIVHRLMQVPIPSGVSSLGIPVANSRPVFYRTDQAANQAANPGYPDLTSRTSRIETAMSTMAAKKTSAAVLWTGEMMEDSIVQWGDAVQKLLDTEGARVFDNLAIDGDTDSTATNINTSGAAPGAENLLTILDGLRKYALTTAGASVNQKGGTFSLRDLFDLLDSVDDEGLDYRDFGFVIPTAIHKNITRTVLEGGYPGGTVKIWPETGDLYVLGYLVVPTPDYSRESKGLSGSNGKVSSTDTDNTTSSFLLVRWDQWAWGRKGDVSIDVHRHPLADSYSIVAHTRVGMAYRSGSNFAAAIGYNVGL